jgi:uncharacterized protein YqgC (DUF456 family)
MHTLGTILGYTGLSLFMLTGLAITPLGLPGNWVIVGCAVVYGFATHWTKFGWVFILMLVVAAVIGEIIEMVAAAFGAKKYGASTGATIAAIVGSVVGLLAGSAIFPIVGSLIGAFAGAFLGAFGYEYIKLNDVERSFRAGTGAFLGRTAVVIAKEAIGVLMVALLVSRFFS